MFCTLSCAAYLFRLNLTSIGVACRQAYFCAKTVRMRTYGVKMIFWLLLCIFFLLQKLYNGVCNVVCSWCGSRDKWMPGNDLILCGCIISRATIQYAVIDQIMKCQEILWIIKFYVFNKYIHLPIMFRK